MRSYGVPTATIGVYMLMGTHWNALGTTHAHTTHACIYFVLEISHDLNNKVYNVLIVHTFYSKTLDTQMLTVSHGQIVYLSTI